MADRDLIVHAYRRAYWREGYLIDPDSPGSRDGRLKSRRAFRYDALTLTPVDRLVAAFLTPYAQSRIRFGSSNIRPRSGDTYPKEFYQ